MGKPSCSSLSKKHRSASNSSISSMNKSIKNPKRISMKKKNKRRTQRKIEKLFAQLKNATDINDFSLETVHNFDNTLEDAVTSYSMSKRKLSPEADSNRKKRKSDGVIIINDEDVTTTESPCKHTEHKPKKICNMQCSTPITKKNNKSLSDILVNTFPENNNLTIQNLNEDVRNLTKEINTNSYVTIDLTSSDTQKSKNVSEQTLDVTEQNQVTVIDLINTTDVNDTSIISEIKPELSEYSLSGESDVTVLRNKQNERKQMRSIAKGIAELNSSQRGHILEYITNKIFNGCQIQNNGKKSSVHIMETILNEDNTGISSTNNSVGSNIYHPVRGNKNKSGLRMIVIDGSNVAMEHGKGKVFSVEGLKICIDFFLKRGHRVKAFVPRFRCKFNKSTNPKLLDKLEREGNVVYTPSREIKGKHITPYDDRYIIQCAAEFDGVIVTGDNYRDLMHENAKWRFVIENRLLPFTWVDDLIMFPKDPLGRNGPTLEQFLRHPSNEVIKIT